jgi:hypothetical protein
VASSKSQTKKPSLAETHPELAAQAEGWDPAMFTPGSSKKVLWKCARGHKWTASICNRSRGTGCPVCSNRKLVSGVNDLATLRPDLALQADGWDPSLEILGAAKRRRWRCELGHIWEATLNKRVSAGRGCPYCAGQKVAPGFNDFATRSPHLLSEVDGWDPTMVNANSGRSQKWRCSLGHSFETSPDVRTRENAGCPYCSSQKLLPGFNDLASKNPSVAQMADGWDPTTVFEKSDKQKMWKCTKGHTYSMAVKHMALGSGCPICLNDRIVPGINDLATTHPEIAAQAFGWDPTTVSYGTTRSFKWKCDLGHVWPATVNSRTHMESGCAVCANRIVLVGFNDLQTINPALASQAYGWNPQTTTISSGVKRKWICEQGHTWSTSPAQRSQGRGCPSCATGGFDPNKPGYLYFIDSFNLHMFQIGITNFPDDRLGDHKRRDWEVIEIRGPMDGHLTQKLETDCLHALEKHGAILGHKAGIEKFDGYTEAWTKKSLNVTSIKQLLDWVYEDEGVRND